MISGNKVTICIPTYNRAHLLSIALNSVIKQNYHKMNILVIDNNSQDETSKIVAGFNDKRITYIKNKTNVGFAGNLQNCYDNVKTPYMIFLADDDLMLQNAVSKLMMLMENHSNCIIGKSANYRFFNNDLAPNIIDKQSNNLIILKRGDEAISKSINYGIGSFSGLIIRKGKQKINVESNGLLSSLIEPLFLLLKDGNFIYLPDVLVGLRCHNNLAYEIYSSSSYSRELFPIYEKLLENKKILKEAKSKYLQYSISDFFNIRLFGSRTGILKETRYIFKYNPAILFGFRFIFFFTLSLFLPRIIILYLKKFFIFLNSKKINSFLIVNRIIKD